MCIPTQTDNGVDCTEKIYKWYSVNVYSSITKKIRLIGAPYPVTCGVGVLTFIFEVCLGPLYLHEKYPNCNNYELTPHSYSPANGNQFSKDYGLNLPESVNFYQFLEALTQNVKMSDHFKIVAIAELPLPYI